MPVQGVFRIRCSGPCGRWLGKAGRTNPVHWAEGYAAVFLSPDDALAAALEAGWTVSGLITTCPTCKGG